jgi:flagellar hook-associated protein 2
MATISSAGIGSGLDVNGIITQLMAVERQPLTALQKEETKLETKVSDIGKVQSLVSALRDKAGALSSVTMWSQTAGSSADASSVAVTTANGAAVGNYSVEVQQLASAQTVSSRVFAAADTPGNFGPGTLTIQLGAWTGDPITGFAPKAGASVVTVTIGAGDDTLAAVRDKINAADAGVTATIVKDASGARLAIRSKTTGAENGFRITAAETSDDGVAANGLSALAYDALGTSQMTLAQRSANALATINGIAVESASNTLTDVSDGVTLKLIQQTSAPVDIKVEADTGAVKTAVQDFVKAFNDLASFVRDQTKYDATSKTAGAMQGDSLVVGLQRQLRAVLNQGSTASTTFTRLADIGITMGSDGTLSTKDSALDHGLANLPELRKLLSADGTAGADTGFMRRYKNLGDALLGADGAFETRTASLHSRMDRNSSQQDQLQARLAATEKRLRSQYEALDKTMGQMSGLSNYMTQQLDALNNFYKAANK